MQSRSGSPSTAWGLGLAACICNLTILFAPVGLVLGLVALVLGLTGSARAHGAYAPALALSGVSFLIAAIWAMTIASIFVLDPTLL
ncbi:hypothetical protein [Paenibacillus sp.]|uniref:hypothetical protein n=1 Tax=Paenibacillus sp. TaxID=58172 RepID=UPI002D4F18F0|nr:hypothetical protein [Paenibacillus sp.]HZG58468.1 hypothetical protein [Paenibacillus sp.]